jgi:NAD(P)-dependent dehydrogenase (short-subunit alcohol dehydrogenase family)
MNVAYVTGVSRGLGEALAARLLATGWHVVGIGRTAGASLAGELFQHVRCDFTDLPAALAAIAPAMNAAAASEPAAGERVILINNAAVAGPMGVLGTLDPAALVSALGVNLIVPVALANAFCAAYPSESRQRLVINISSGLAGRAMAGSSLYCVAKCGMEMLTRSLNADFPVASFRAITLRPGIIDTPMQEYMRTRSAEELPDVAMFQEFHASGQLVDAHTVAIKTCTRLVDADVEANRIYTYAEL